jgi:hypothetical protein
MRMHLVAAALLLSPVAVRAAPIGPEFGFRAAYAVPSGAALGDGSGGATAMKDLVRGGVPFSLEVGYRFAPEFYAGVSGGYAILFVNGCDASESCSGRDFRLGLDLRFHLAPSARIDPWVGVGVAYEWLGLSASSGGQGQDVTLRGLEFFNAQVGADFLASPGLRFGPFAALSLGRYSDASASSALLSVSGEIFDKKIHRWALVGLRATFNP